MFQIKSKAFKRKDIYHINLEVMNLTEEKLVSTPDHQIHIRPRKVIVNETTVLDPEFGRSDDIDVFDAGETLIVKTKISEADLKSATGLPGGRFEIHYGVVQEFVKWYEPFDVTAIEIQNEEAQCSESVLSPE